MSENSSVFFKLHERLQHAIVHRLRWRELRPVQEQTVQVVQAGLNAIVLAPTAGGKTEAAMFGILDALLRNPGSGLRVLYLSPLRALLNNQEPRLQELTKMVGFSAFKWHGDVSANSKQAFARDPKTLLMTTPESLQVMMMSERYDQRALFGNLAFVVIDEIHGFAGDDRGDHLIVLLEQLSRLGKDFQRVGLSATVGNPEHLLDWLQGSSRRKGTVVDPRGEPQRKIIQIIPLPKEVDPAPTAATLARGKKSLIFADSRTRVEKLKMGLERSGIRAFPHHGSLSRYLRERSEEAFRAGSNCAIVSTSTLELGLDVGDLDLVLQLESPATVSAFLQRLGRSGRRAGTVARMTFLCKKPENFLVACALISLAMKRWVEPVELSTASYPMYVHYVLATVLGRKGATRGDLVRGEGTPYCFSHISSDERQHIIDEMLEQKVLHLTDSLYVIGSGGERRFGRSNFMTLYSAFETPPLLSVRTTANQEIGQLEAWFVLASEKSMTFVLGGKAWQTQRVDWRRGLLIVKPAPKGALPCWMGTPALLSREVCQQVKELLRGSDSPPYLGDRGLRELERQRDAWADSVESPSFSITTDSGATLLHTFAGGKINNVIARYHHHRTGQKSVPNNFSVKVEGNASDIGESLQSLAQISADDTQLASMLSTFEDSRLSKFQSCLPSDLEARFLSSRLLDLAGAQSQCASFCEARPVARLQAPVTSIEPEFESDDLFLCQLAHLAETERLTTKWVFVPNNRWKNSLAERLVRSGCDWVNFRFVTPFELAVDTAAPVLIAAGMEPRPEGLGPALMLSLLERLPENEFGYYRPLRQNIEILEALWGTVWELRLDGVNAHELPTEKPKEKELKALFGAYELYLKEQCVADRAHLLLTALECETPTSPEDILLELPQALWSGLERLWLDSLDGKRVQAWVAQLEPARRFQVLSPHRSARDNSDVNCDRHLLRYLNRYEETPAPARDSTLNLFYAGRRDAEVREVFRRVFSERLPLDEVEIVLADPADQSVVADFCAQVDVECNFADGVPVLSTRTGQALSCYLDFLRNDCSTYYLRRLLLGEYLKPEELSAVRAAQLLDRVGATRGREAIRAGISAARDSAAQREYEELSEQYQLLGKWLEKLLGTAPVFQSEIVVRELAQCCVDFLGQLKISGRGPETAAVAVLARRLGELTSLGSLALSITDAFRLINQRLQCLRCATDRARPGKLHVTSIKEFGLSGRKYTFLVGLEEGALSTTAFENPVLGDATREKLRDSLALSGDKQDEVSYLLYSRLAALDGSVTFSFSTRDMATGEERYPGALFFSAARLLYPTIADYDSLLEVLCEPVGLIPETGQQDLTDAGWWLKALRKTPKNGASAVLEAFPWLGKGHQALSARQSELFTAFDGLVPSLAGKLVPSEDSPVSVSQLQDLATCAFRTFLGKGLAVRPPELERPDPGLWLEPAARGTVLHEVFAKYHGHLREQRRSVNETSDFALLSNLLDAELCEIAKFQPAPSEYVRVLEMERLHKDLRNFLSLEATASGRTPIAFEVGFGLPGSSEAPFGTEKPVGLSFAPDLTLYLRGRIDRIDELANGFEVIDYKTGAKLSRSRGVRYDAGKLVQHALYALVAEQLLDSGPVTATSYYFPTVGPERAWLRFDPPDRAELAAVIRDLLFPLQHGVFPQTADSKACTYCDFKAACLERSETDLRATLANSQNKYMEWRRRLDLLK